MENVAGALGRVRITDQVDDRAQLPSLIFRAKYAGDLAAAHRVQQMVTAWLLAESRAWPVRSRMPHKVMTFARLVVFSSLHPNHCHTCSGRGALYPEHRAASTCPVCNGSGAGKGTQTECGHAMGMRQQSWDESWDKRWQDWRGRLDALERSAVIAVASECLDI